MDPSYALNYFLGLASYRNETLDTLMPAFSFHYNDLNEVLLSSGPKKRIVYLGSSMKLFIKKFTRTD